MCTALFFHAPSSLPPSPPRVNMCYCKTRLVLLLLHEDLCAMNFSTTGTGGEREGNFCIYQALFYVHLKSQAVQPVTVRLAQLSRMFCFRPKMIFLFIYIYYTFLSYIYIFFITAHQFDVIKTLTPPPPPPPKELHTKTESFCLGSQVWSSLQSPRMWPRQTKIQGTGWLQWRYAVVYDTYDAAHTAVSSMFSLMLSKFFPFSTFDPGPGGGNKLSLR